ncbi:MULTISPECIES: LuxR family transcriptional regulator [unclassified Duganella]|uniref:helix-turn-helix transcriptional regulator n=1 Tax=unclassified Duganella TaxID=2636909 RepID=UPI000A8B9E43|nr:MULTISPECIES: LuxR family transcriptional regulator [unclassified Duganella]
MLKQDQLHTLMEAQSDTEWAQALAALAAQLGFEYSLFGVVPNRAQPLESAFLVSNYPSEWRAAYDKLHLHAVDPTVSHCLGSSLPIIWQPASFQGERQQQFYEQAASYGLRAGVTLPVHGRSGEFGMLSFVSDQLQPKAGAGQLELLASVALVRDYAQESARKFSPGKSTAPAVKLTARELECLKWVAAGKSSWEVSRILGRSEATVNFHLANIMRKFDVSTRQQAIVKSIAAGLVAPE